MSYSPISSALLLLLVVQCMSIHAESSCRKAPFLYVFGDSNSDTGAYSVVSATVPKLPDGRVFFNKPTGRICDGRLVIDLLCESLGTKYLSPFFKLFSSLSDYSNGMNFAIAGSETFRDDKSGALDKLDVQVRQFGFFYNLSITNGFMSVAHFRDDALYFFDIGQNDIDLNFDKFSYDELLQRLPTTVSNIKAAIQTVYSLLGGRKFWVHGTGPLGCLPNSVAKKNASKPLDEFGCIARENELAMKLNAGIKTMCEELRSTLSDATIVFVDLYSIKLDLVVNATTYGFGDPFTACRNTQEKTVCPLGARHVSWDGIHYTEAANMFVKSKILSTNFSTPPMEFNFFCS